MGTPPKFVITDNIPEEKLDEGYLAPSQTATDDSPRIEVLPGQEILKNINWLGSSYSGVDIKVVAHLYTPLKETDESAALRDQQDQANKMHDACIVLASALPAGSDQTGWRSLYASNDRIAESANTSMSDPAGPFVVSIFRTVPRSGDLNVLRSRMLLALTSQAEVMKSVATELDSKISSIEEIRKKASHTVTLGTLQTMSVQTFREKEAVRALGMSYVKGYTRGPRTIGGSMIFTVFNEHALSQLIRSMSGQGSIYGEMDNDLSTYIVDQLPPIDLTIVFANEYGSLSQMGIYGVEFVTDGMTMSIEDILTESVCQFVARDVDIMTSQGTIALSKAQRGMHFRPDGTRSDAKASDLIFTSQDAYAKYLERLGMRRKRNTI